MTTLTRYLKLRLGSDLTEDARYNLRRLDSLASTFVVDTNDNLDVRSITDITIEPECADIGGSGSGGTVEIGTSGHEISALNVYSELLSLSGLLALDDQAAGGTRSLHIQYKSNLSGLVDTTANRILSIDPQGADRELVMGGNISTTGGNLALSLSAATALTLPVTGTLATLAGTETLTGKSIDAATNSLTNIRNASIASDAAISYSKLALTGAILATDLAGSIPYSKLILTGAVTNSDLAGSIAYSKLSLSGALQLADLDSGFLLPVSKGGTGAGTAAGGLNALLPSQTSASGRALVSDGSNASWVALAGTGTVTSVGLVLPDVFTVSNSPITDSGSLTATLASQSANRLLAGPTTGSAATPTFRALVAADLPALSTSDISEGSNQYYTAARFNSAFSAKSTSDLSEGSNLYYTAARFNTAFSGKSTSDLTEGSNLYYTLSRFNTALATKSTADLTEGSNLYFTTARVDNQVATYGVTATWITGDGASKAVTHNLGTTNVRWNIFDIDSGEEIWVGTVIRTSANVLTFTASEAPSGSGWTVTVRKL